MFARTPPLVGNAEIVALTVDEINILGTPGITVPAGYYDNESPFSLIFLGEPFSEAELLGYAYDYEQATQHRVAPTLAVLGDFNANGMFDTADIDALSNRVASRPSDVVFDLNGDRRATFSDMVLWVEEFAGTYLGDANVDGEFNSSDMVVVFQAGEYEDDLRRNSAWSEGDWNGDREFTSADMVTAFAAGGYEKGPRTDAVAVPEPDIAFLSLLVLLVSIHAHRRR